MSITNLPPEQGVIIQITKEDHPWMATVLIIDEVKPWGVIAYAIIPQSNDGSVKPGQAYTRLEYGDFDIVGEATIILGEPDGEDEDGVPDE